MSPLRLFFFFILLFVSTQSALAQSEHVTLVLLDGEEIECRVIDIWQGDVRFEAVSARQAYKFGEFISLQKLSGIRLQDGRTLTPDEFLAHWKGEAVQPKPAPTEGRTSAPRASAPAETKKPEQITPEPSPSGPGMRLTPALLDTTRRSGIGLRLPEMPPQTSGDPVEYTQIAEMISEAGLAGKLLYEIAEGELRGRDLTASQKKLLDAIQQTRGWNLRKQDLFDAQKRAHSGFIKEYQLNRGALEYGFQFTADSPGSAFLEFVQFLHAENAHRFQDKWERVEQTLDAETVSALRDLLNNYDDWLYLYGRYLQK